MHSNKLVWIVLPTLAVSASAQVNNTNKPVRLISLSETLELVLAHNLNLKIERIYPEVARYNVDLAKAGGSDRVGLQRLGTPSVGESITERNVSYDPTFFAYGSKSYVSYPNYLTQDRYTNLKNDAANSSTANNTRATDNYAKELDNQTSAVRDIAVAQGQIANSQSSKNGIMDDLRTGKLDPGTAQSLLAAEDSKMLNASNNVTQANSIIANSYNRKTAAQALDARNQALNSSASLERARAADLQNWLNGHSVGSRIPDSGLINPQTGDLVYSKEIVRNYDFGTGFRGALPIGTVYEIRVDTELQKSTLFDKEYSSIASITLGQPLLKNFLTDASRTGIATSRKDLEIMQWGLQFSVMNYMTLAQNAYYDLIFAYENVEVNKKALELAEAFMALTTRRVEANLLPPLDLKQAQSQAASARADLLTAQRDLYQKENALKSLMSDDFVKWQQVRLQPADKLVAVAELYNLTDSWSKALQLRPEYNQARLELEKQNIILKFRRNQLLPSLDIVGTFAQNGVSYDSLGQSYRNIDGGDPSYFFGAIFSMPLFNRDARARMKITEADKRRALLLMQNLEQSILIQVDDNIKIAEADYNRIAATREAREAAQAAVEAYQKMFENGKVTSFEVLQMQKNLTSARFLEINAMAAYNKALAQLYFSEGTTLDRNHIRVQINK